MHNFVRMAEDQIAGREDDKTLVYQDYPKEEHGDIGQRAVLKMKIEKHNLCNILTQSHVLTK